MEKTLKFAGYCRVSTLKQANFGVSIDQQKQKIMTYCSENSHDLIRIYSDEGKSGLSLKREEYGQLIKDCEAGLYDGLIFYDIDRASRSFIQLINDINKLFKLGIKIISITKGEIDLDNPESELLFNQMASFARYESRKIARRVKDSIYYCNSIGRHIHKPPFGYKKVRKKLVIDDTTAPIVTRIFKDFISNPGMSLNKLSKTYRKTVRGIKIILSNPVYVGCVRNNDKIFKGNHSAIVSKELFDKVREKLKKI